MGKTKRYYWLKLQKTFFDRLEIIIIRESENGDTKLIIYQRMLLLSLENDGYLYYQGLKETLEEEISIILKEDVNTIKELVDQLKTTGLLLEDGKNYYLTDVVSLTGSETDSARRMRELRERQQKASQCDTSVTESDTSVTQSKSNNKSNIKSNNKSTKEETKKEINDFFERVWELYPKKAGKAQVSDTRKKKLYQIGEEELKRAIQRYEDGLLKEPWRKPQNGSTFFNSGYVDYLDANYKEPPEQQPERNPASVLSCEREYDFDEIEKKLMEKQWEDEPNT